MAVRVVGVIQDVSPSEGDNTKVDFTVKVVLLGEGATQIIVDNFDPQTDDDADIRAEIVAKVNSEWSESVTIGELILTGSPV